MHLHPLTNELIEHKQIMQEYKYLKHFPSGRSQSAAYSPNASQADPGSAKAMLESKYQFESLEHNESSSPNFPAAMQAQQSHEMSFQQDQGINSVSRSLEEDSIMAGSM